MDYAEVAHELTMKVLTYEGNTTQIAKRYAELYKAFFKALKEANIFTQPG